MPNIFCLCRFAFEAETLFCLCLCRFRGRNLFIFCPCRFAFGAETLFCPCRLRFRGRNYLYFAPAAYAFGAEIKKSDLVALFYFATAFLAASANCVNAAASVTAKSANILRLTSIPATFKPCIKRL